MAIDRNIVGPKSLTTGSTNAEQRIAATGGQVVCDAHGRYHEAAARGNLYMASMQAGAALGTALTATAVTFTLYNPANSGVIISLLNCALAITSAPAGSAALVYAINNNPVAAAPGSVTALAVRGMPLGNAGVGKALAYSAATLPAIPVVAKALATILATGSTAGMQINDDVAGAILLGPNSAVTIQNIGTACNGIVSMIWEEIPLLV